MPPFITCYLLTFKDDILHDETIQYNGTGSGTEHALNFILVGSSMQRSNVYSPTEFNIGLTSSNEYFDMKKMTNETEIIIDIFQ